jgi:hypothetical protein
LYMHGRSTLLINVLLNDEQRIRLPVEFAIMDASYGMLPGDD